MANKPRLSKKRIINALHDTKGAVYLAAKRLQCSPRAVYGYINNHPEIKEVKDYYDGELLDIGEVSLRSAVIDKEQWAVKFLLSTKGKDRGYVPRQEHSGTDGQPIPIAIIKMDTEEL